MYVKHHVYLLMQSVLCVDVKHHVYLLMQSVLCVDVKHHVYLLMQSVLCVDVKHHVYLLMQSVLCVDVKRRFYLLMQERESGRTRTASTDSNKEAIEEDTPEPAKANGDLLPPKDNNHDDGGGDKKTARKPNFLTALKRAIKKRRTKITMLTSLWKIALTVAYPALAFGYGSESCVRAFFYFHDVPRVSNASAGAVVAPPLAENCSLFKSLDFVDEMTCHDYYPLLMAAVNVGCSILCYKVSVDTICLRVQHFNTWVTMSVMTMISLCRMDDP